MSAVRVTREGELLHVTLARPERRNAFDAAMIAELTEAFAGVGDARIVVVSGEGPVFSAGADLEWMRNSASLTREENVADALRAADMFEAIDACPAPVVCRVHGSVFGGGIGLVACADVAIAAEDCVFAFSETRVGIIPGVVSPYAIAAIGNRAARRYLVTGERFDAREALRVGLVHEVAPDVDAALARVVAELLACGPEAARAAKRLVRDRPVAPETAERIAERRVSAEGQEGLSAFLERRAPAWRSGSSS